MQSDTADCTSEYYTSNEIIDENSSPIYIEVVSTDENDIKEDQNDASRRSSQVKQEVKKETKREISPEEGAKKRKNDILDDFFALGEPSIKKKKKSKKLKHAHRNATDEDNTINSALNIQPVTDSVDEDVSLDVEEITVSKTKTPDRKEKALRNRMGSVTPPPVFDKEALLAKRMKLKRLSEANSFDIEDDDDDLEILQQSSYRRSHTPSGSQSGSIGYQFTDENESKRNYILKVTSKLIDGKDIHSTFRTKGTNRFSKTLDSIISYFLKVQKGVEYTSDDVSLIWIDGRMEIKPFFKPSTLRIQPITPNGTKKSPRASTYLYCLLIPKSNLETFTSTYSEFETSASSLKKITDLTDEIEQIDEQEHDDTSMYDASDVGESKSISSRPIVIDLDEEDNESYFVIGLKGKDNKRIEVQVSPVTQIRKLLLYFLKTKGIQESEVNMKTVKLIFDDEELNLDDVVGDTELEEDFEVQIVI
ncbi:unnamed protein product [Debaryomyces tyrocola]|nr:unnamed protein product [Debaryomyces tyrocola]